jgi:uncharacterized protein YjiS (DUF1127 family)
MQQRIHDLVCRLHAWLDARKRAADDGAALATMSERELRDIGIDRASIDAVASGRWTRDRL